MLAGGFANKRPVRVLYTARALTEPQVIRFVLSLHELQQTKASCYIRTGPVCTLRASVWTLTSLKVIVWAYLLAQILDACTVPHTEEP